MSKRTVANKKIVLKDFSQREAVEIKWDSRKERYVAKMKHYPAVMAYGDTLAEAQQNIERVRYEYIHGTEETA